MRIWTADRLGYSIHLRDSSVAQTIIHLLLSGARVVWMDDDEVFLELEGYNYRWFSHQVAA